MGIKRNKLYLSGNESLWCVGRPKRVTWDIFYTKKNIRIVGMWIRLGWSHEKIAKEIGITRQTFYRWYNEHAEFKKAVDDAKITLTLKAVEGLEDKLAPRTLKSKKITVYTDKKGQITGQKEENTITEVQADSSLVKFALSSLAGDTFSDKATIEMTGAVDVKGLDIVGLLASAKEKAKKVEEGEEDNDTAVDE